jgi:hypothetical protein
VMVFHWLSLVFSHHFQRQCCSRIHCLHVHIATTSASKCPFSFCSSSSVSVQGTHSQYLTSATVCISSCKMALLFATACWEMWQLSLITPSTWRSELFVLSCHIACYTG